MGFDVVWCDGYTNGRVCRRGENDRATGREKEEFMEWWWSHEESGQDLWSVMI